MIKHQLCQKDRNIDKRTLYTRRLTTTVALTTGTSDNTTGGSGNNAGTATARAADGGAARVEACVRQRDRLDPRRELERVRSRVVRAEEVPLVAEKVKACGACREEARDELGAS